MPAFLLFADALSGAPPRSAIKSDIRHIAIAGVDPTIIPWRPRYEELCDEGVARLFAIVGAVLAGGYPTNAASLDTMTEVGDAIQACWTPPADAGNATVTLSFSFKRDGTLIGPPRPTAIKVDGDANAKKAFVDAATTALQKCLPLSFRPSLHKA